VGREAEPGGSVGLVTHAAIEFVSPDPNGFCKIKGSSVDLLLASCFKIIFEIVFLFQHRICGRDYPMKYCDSERNCI
jgi:hypothetical protein